MFTYPQQSDSSDVVRSLRLDAGEWTYLLEEGKAHNRSPSQELRYLLHWAIELRLQGFSPEHLNPVIELEQTKAKYGQQIDDLKKTKAQLEYHCDALRELVRLYREQS